MFFLISALRRGTLASLPCSTALHSPAKGLRETWSRLILPTRPLRMVLRKPVQGSSGCCCAAVSRLSGEVVRELTKMVDGKAGPGAIVNMGVGALGVRILCICEVISALINPKAAKDQSPLVQLLCLTANSSSLPVKHHLRSLLAVFTKA